MNESLERHTDLVNTNAEIKDKLFQLGQAINKNDDKLMISLSKEISNLSKMVSSALKEESLKLTQNINENEVVTSAKVSKAIDKLIEDNKKNSNLKMLKELSNSTSSLTAALKTISSQNKMLVREITEQKESITFP